MALKMPVKVKKFELNGDYAGFTFSARTNFSVGMAEEISSGEVSALIDAFTEIITKWNFVDVEGNPLGPPSDREAMRHVPLEMLNLMSTAITEEVTAVPKD